MQKQRANDAFWLESSIGSSAVRALERQLKASTTPVLLFTAALPDFLALALHARLRSAAKALDPTGGPAPLPSDSNGIRPDTATMAARSGDGVATSGDLFVPTGTVAGCTV